MKRKIVRNIYIIITIIFNVIIIPIIISGFHDVSMKYNSEKREYLIGTIIYLIIFIIYNAIFIIIRIIRKKKISKVEIQETSDKEINEYSVEKPNKRRFATKAKTGFGCFVQIIATIFMLGSGLWAWIWTVKILSEYVGGWAAFLGVIGAPITFFASILIAWIAEKSFPLEIAILYICFFIGIALLNVGSKVGGIE